MRLVDVCTTWVWVCLCVCGGMVSVDVLYIVVWNIFHDMSSLVVQGAFHSKIRQPVLLR